MRLLVIKSQCYTQEERWGFKTLPLKGENVTELGVSHPRRRQDTAYVCVRALRKRLHCPLLMVSCDKPSCVLVGKLYKVDSL